MAVTTDIVASYRHPGRVVTRLAAGPRQEARLLAYVMLACLLIFIAQMPRLSRDAALDPSAGFAERASGDLLFWMIFAPLACYGLAAVSHMLARMFGGQGDWYDARLALFWALLAASPLWLLRGMVAGFLGRGLTLDLVGTLALGGFLTLWLIGLRRLYRRAKPVAQSHKLT